MSPEQLQGDAIDQRTDIWSLGTLLHEMLTGVRPFEGDDRQTVSRAILSEHPNLVATSHPTCPSASIASCTGRWRDVRERLGAQPHGR